VGKEVEKLGIMYLSWHYGIREGGKAIWLATCRQEFGRPNVLSSYIGKEILPVILFGLFD